MQAKRARAATVPRYGSAVITALVLSEPPLEALATTLAALVPGVADGLIADAVVLARTRDGELERLADAVGATFVVAPERDPWAAGAAVARRDWLLCLRAGDVPGEGWIRTLDRFLALARPERRFARLPRRHASIAARLRALLAPRRGITAGDLVHRSLLAPGALIGRPYVLRGYVERDPAFD